MALQNISIGDTGAQLISKLSNNFRDTYIPLAKSFDITKYGAVGDNNTDNTSAIQAAIQACATAGGGRLYIPSGIYKTHTLEIGPKDAGPYYNINIEGDGPSSILRSISAEVLLKYTDYPGFFRRFSNFVLDGNNVGTIGLQLINSAYFNLTNIYFHNIVTNGLKLTGSLIGSINNCYWWNDGVNGNICVNAEPIMYPEGDPKYGQIMYANNLVTFRDCVFYAGRKWAINWDSGSLLKLDGCNFEWNGNLGDLTTGCIYYKNNQEIVASYAFTPGLFMEGCWIEGNAGIQVLIDDPGRADLNVRHVISNSHFTYNYSPTPNVKIIGIVSNNHLVLRGSNLAGFNGLWAYGANCHVVSDCSNDNPATRILDSGASYRVSSANY